MAIEHDKGPLLEGGRLYPAVLAAREILQIFQEMERRLHEQAIRGNK